MDGPKDWTLLLERARGGDDGAREEILPRIYDLLRQAAAAALQRFAGRSTLQPTALVHEAYIKVFGGATPAFADRAHFLAVAARAMRRILVDHARARPVEAGRRRAAHRAR
jgi:RNA polymerase sigma factor (TIGR02999 family)